jgi:hypothetical protein
VAELEAQSLTLRTATVEDVTRLCSELRLADASEITLIEQNLTQRKSRCGEDQRIA